MITRVKAARYDEISRNGFKGKDRVGKKMLKTPDGQERVNGTDR